MKPVHRVILAGLLMEGCFVGMVALGDLRHRVPSFLLLHLSAFLAYLLAVLPAWKRSPDRRFLTWIAAFGLLFRITLWCSPPTLSDDLYRYLWDGRVQAHGVNPYRYPPDAPELKALRDPRLASVNHPEIPTIYPPLAQAVFLLISLVSPTPLAVKVAFTLFDLGIAWALSRLLLRRGRPPEALIVYLWSPLVVVEVAGGGHMDALAIFCLVAALLWAEEGRSVRASVALSLSILSKLFAAALIPAFWMWRPHPLTPSPTGEGEQACQNDKQARRPGFQAKSRFRHGGERAQERGGGAEGARTATEPELHHGTKYGAPKPLRRLRSALSFVPLFFGRAKKSGNRDGRGDGRWPLLLIPLIVLAGYLPYAGAGDRLFTGLRAYAEHWQFNDLTFRYIAAWTDTPDQARQAVALLFGLIALVLAIRKTDPLTSACVLVGAFLLLTPTLHPWYALWIIPFLAFRKSLAWLLLTGLVPLSYHVLIRYVAEGVWAEAGWVRWAEFGPFAALYVGEKVWEKKKSGATGRPVAPTTDDDV